jgi:hypothetical protein
MTTPDTTEPTDETRDTLATPSRDSRDTLANPPEQAPDLDAQAEQDPAEATDAEAPEDPEPAADAEQFPRAYVEKLRAEAARYRDRAKQADTLAQRLHVELVRATGKLADPTDLPFDPGHLEDPEALTAAVEDLLTAKPHLASRRPVGQIGQGERGLTREVSLLNLLRGR